MKLSLELQQEMPAQVICKNCAQPIERIPGSPGGRWWFHPHRLNGDTSYGQAEWCDVDELLEGSEEVVAEPSCN